MNTGGDLLNADQPVYVLAAATVDDVTARELLSPLGLSDSEAHFTSLRRSATGREGILHVLGSLRDDQVVTGVVHKRYMIYAKLVDDFIDVAYYRDTGRTLVEGGAHRATANLLFWTAPLLMQGEDTELEKRFVDMCRRRDHTAIESFFSFVRRGARRGPEDLREWFMIVESLRGRVHALLHDTFPLDPSLTTFVALVSRFAGVQLGKEPFAVDYDRSNVMEAQQDMLERLCDQSREPVVFGGGSRRLRLPLPVTPLRFVDSATSPAVQLADLVAGATGAAMRARVRENSSGFHEALLEVTSPWIVHAVWPSKDDIAGRDEVAFPIGEDPATVTGNWLADHP